MKVLLLLVAALMVAGCDIGTEVSPLIDGIRVGPVIDCGSCIHPNTGPNCGACESVLSIARMALDEGLPGHAPI